MKFNVFYIDPPYSYKNKRTGGSLKSGASQQYQTMTLNDLKSLPIQKICEKDAVLFQWATVPLLPEALHLMECWGFQYKTMITWRKIMSWGMGYWFRGQTEHLLLGIRGKIKPFRVQKANFIQEKVGKHSEKPEIFRELIDDATKNIVDRKMVELFARKKVDGWFSIGYDVDGSSIENSIQHLMYIN